MTVLQLHEGPFADYMKLRREVYDTYCPDVREASMISEYNWLERYGCRSGKDLGILVNPGDLAMIEFGQNFYNEAGFQHFGLVVSISVCKALVIPMTSNPNTCRKAYDPVENPRGKRNLFCIGKVDGMDKESVLFLNDARYINTARVIRVMAHIDTDEKMFHEIVKRLKSIMFPVF